MKRNTYLNNDKNRYKKIRREQQAGGFKCSHCHKWVAINAYIGTANRNHCNHCLWSKHVDIKKGDRKEDCRGGMKPIGLTFKHEGFGRQGELMLVHECASCSQLSINRVAADDIDYEILSVFDRSCELTSRGVSPFFEDIVLLGPKDESEVRVQLFGKPC